MKRNSLIIAVLLFAFPVYSQAPKPSGFGNLGAWTMWIETGSITMTNKSLTAPTLTGITTLTTTNAATTGTYRSLNIGHTQTGASASAIIEAMRVNVDANVMTGDWTNAVVARVDYGASGNANGGMVAPLCAELSLPPTTQSGGIYQVADLEMEAPTGYLNGANIALPTTWLNFGLYGNSTAKASLEDYAYFFRTDGFTTGTGNMIYQNTMRVMLEGASWYLPLSDAEGEYSTAYLIDVSNTTDASSLTAGSIATDGGLAVAKQIYLGDDLDMSVSSTGVYDITLKDGQADALSIVRGTTDMVVFNTSTPLITFTPAVTITGAVTGSSTISAATSFDPDAADGTTLGTAALEFSDLFLADGGVINFGNDQDVTLTHVADTGLLLNAAMKLEFRDATETINSSADGQLDIDATTEVEIATTTVDLNGALDVSGSIVGGSTISAATSFDPDAAGGAALGTNALEFSGLFLTDGAAVNFGADQDVTLTHVADTGILLNAAMALQFRDATEVINSSADGQLDIDATTEVEIATGTLDLNGALDVSGNIVGGGLATVTYPKTAAADVGTQRVVYGKYALTGSTPVTTAGNNMVGARGEFNLGTGGVLSFNAGSSFASGVQGKIVSSGTSTIGATTGDQDARIQAVHGQMDLTGMTINGGQVSIAEFDVQVRPAAINGVNQFNLLKITDASASTTAQAASIIYAYAEAALFMDLYGPENTADWIVPAATGTTDCTASGGTDPSYALKISVNGIPAYIRVWATP